MQAKTYNGWTNYETWCVALWIDNEQGSHTYARHLAQAAYDEAEADSDTRKENAVGPLADSLKEMIEEANPLAETATLFTDLLNSALGEVNWREIAENYLDDVMEVDEDTNEGDSE